ncbi:MAG: hypothetical protein DWP97_00300 [Calditrichaeota bacterium]|nr:MAG: hypothetical protein DWP97_00300 [Calditrichota bacterium]
MKKRITIYVFLLVVFVLFPFSSFSGQVTLDHVYQSWDDAGVTTLIPGCDETAFYIRVNNNSENYIASFTTGFKVWTINGSSFTPITGEWLDPNINGYFDMVVAINPISADGVGADTIGFGGTRLFSTGLPPGYNEIAYVIRTGNFQEGETVCLDSSWYPPTGSWFWAPDGPADWDGPHCFPVESCGCGWPIFANCPDTLTIPMDTIEYYDFNGFMTEWFIFSYEILDGPGSITPMYGEWTYTPQPSDAGTYQTLNLLYSGICQEDHCSVVLKFVNCDPTIDINGDCMSDVGDLVFLVEFMFAGGEPPVDFNLADADGNGLLDIADLVYIVDYMFGGGPPPVG